MSKNDSTMSNGKAWALILGSSSGFGGATAIELSRLGINIFGVHFDRAATMPQVNEIIEKIKKNKVNVVFFNINAADEKSRGKAIEQIKKTMGQEEGSYVKVLMHSLAFGSLGPFFGKNAADSLTQKQVEMTLDVMANSLVYWAQAVFFAGLFKRGSRVFAMTSSGGHTVLPNYGAVSASKAALESHIRQIAMELGPYGVTANSIMAGVTDTPALRKIPNSKQMLSIAVRKNPSGRPTKPEDVARAIALLCDDRATFISGNLIGVDGGEDIVSYIGQLSPNDLGDGSI